MKPREASMFYRTMSRYSLVSSKFSSSVDSIPFRSESVSPMRPLRRAAWAVRRKSYTWVATDSRVGMVM